MPFSSLSRRPAPQDSASPVRTWSFVRREQGWTLLGAPSFMGADTPTIMAHDVVHHRDGDQGSFFDEMASVGAESYFDHAAARLDSSTLATTVHSIMSLYWEGQGLEALHLPPAQDSLGGDVDIPALDIPVSVEDTWRHAWGLACSETVDYWGLAHDLQAAFLLSEEYAQAAQRALRMGWEAAASRWPIPKEGEALYQTIESSLRESMPLGTQVDVSRTAEGMLLVETQHASPSPVPTLVSPIRPAATPVLSSVPAPFSMPEEMEHTTGHSLRKPRF